MDIYRTQEDRRRRAAQFTRAGKILRSLENAESHRGVEFILAATAKERQRMLPALGRVILWRALDRLRDLGLEVQSHA